MHTMIFSCYAASQKDASRALLLAESIRTFAGEYSNLPFLLMLPNEDNLLTSPHREIIEHLGVEVRVFKIDPITSNFPFAGKVMASAAAEMLCDGRASQLVWMDNGTLVVNTLDRLLLKQGIRLGYRPVDHLLIGSPYDQPVDPFWEYIYSACGVTMEDISPMLTSTDQVKMRPYINAGMLVVRPEKKLLERWRDAFLGIYQESRPRQFYAENSLYKIFIHQAVLAGCVLAGYQQEETMALPPEVNYPLHMHTQYPAHLQPISMNQLVSFRYENFFTKPDWNSRIQVHPPLEDWLEEYKPILSRR